MEILTQPQKGPPFTGMGAKMSPSTSSKESTFWKWMGTRSNAGPSRCVFAPQGTAHEFQNIGATPGRILVMVQLAGLGTFFTDLAGATAGVSVNPTCP